MSILTKTLIAAGMSLAIAGAAHASDASEWTIKANQGYIVDMSGNTMVVDLNVPTKKLMAHAKEVRRGTVFFMHDGKLMMAFDHSLIGIMSR